MRSGISPRGPSMARTLASGLSGGNGNGPSPLRLFSRAIAGGIDQRSGRVDSFETISALRASVEEAMADGKKTLGSTAGMAGLFPRDCRKLVHGHGTEQACRHSPHFSSSSKSAIAAV